MKKNKNLKGFICMALALVMVLGSSFAYFTDRADTSANGTAGTVGVDLTSDINLLDEDGKDILNPGDLRDGSFGVENTGNKSIDVRTTIVLTSSEPMNTEADQAEYELYLKDDVHFEEGKGWMPNDGAKPIEVRSISEDGKTITYNVPDYILNGNEDFGDDKREIEDGITTDSHDNDFVLIFKAGSSNDFQDSVVTIDVLVEAKQHRNTGAGWDIVAQESYVSGAINQNAVLKAEGSEGDIEVEVPEEPVIYTVTCKEKSYGDFVIEFESSFCSVECPSGTYAEVFAYLDKNYYGDDYRLRDSNDNLIYETDPVTENCTIFIDNFVESPETFTATVKFDDDLPADSYSSVTIQLRDNYYGRVNNYVLSEENNWSFEFNAVSGQHILTLLDLTDTDGYTADIVDNTYTITIGNPDLDDDGNKWLKPSGGYWDQKQDNENIPELPVIP